MASAIFSWVTSNNAWATDACSITFCITDFLSPSSASTTNVSLSSKRSVCFLLLFVILSASSLSCFHSVVLLFLYLPFQSEQPFFSYLLLCFKFLFFFSSLFWDMLYTLHVWHKFHVSRHWLLPPCWHICQVVSSQLRLLCVAVTAFLLSKNFASPSQDICISIFQIVQRISLFHHTVDSWMHFIRLTFSSWQSVV